MGLCPPWGIPNARRGNSRDRVGAAGQATGSSPQPGVKAHPSGRVLVLLPPKQLHSLHSHLRGAFPKAWRGVPVTSLAASWCPPCSSRCPGVRLSVPSPPCPFTPHQPVWNRCHLSQLPPLPGARSLAPPIHFTMILFLAISGSTGAPPAPRPPPVSPVGAALGGSEPSWEVTVL